MAPPQPYLIGGIDRDFKHEKPIGIARCGGKRVLLDLDTDRDKLVRKMLRRNKNSRTIYHPKSSPHLNAVEEYWR